MFDAIQDATRFIRSHLPHFRPRAGIILGTGLGGLVKELRIEAEIPYERIPHFPVSTVEFHSGKLFLGTLAGQPVVCLQGRFHFYEGYSMQQITFPVRVLQALGIEALFVSNAAGGLNPDFRTSDLMLLDDHISLLLPESPLRGHNLNELGPRWPDMSQPYDPVLIEKAGAIAARLGLALRRGTYVSVGGPQLETKAEYRFLRQIGADAVGMSTVPEVIVARHMGLRCCAVSVITDLCIPETLEEADIQKIIAAAAKAEPSLTRLFCELIREMSS